MKKNPPDKAKLEVDPDAWERFERAADVVIKARPKHRPAKGLAATKGRVRKSKSRA